MDTQTPTLRSLFGGFFIVGIQGFGGVLPWARRMLVEDRHWLDDRGFTELLGLGQILPGPNIVNVSVVVGARFHGAIGALVAVAGLMAAPLGIVLALAILYDHYGQLPALQHALAGISAVAAGLVLAIGIKLAQQLERSYWCYAVGLVTFLAVAWWRIPLLAILLVLAPIGIALAYRSRHPLEPT